MTPPEKDMGHEVFVPVHDEDAMRGFILQALRAQTDAVSGIREQGEKRDGKLDEIGKVLHSIDKRLTIIENNSLERDIRQLREDFDEFAERLEPRLVALEAVENQRKGAVGILDFIAKYWPALIGFAGLVALILERTGGKG